MTKTCAGCTYSHDFPRHDHGQEFANLGTAIDGLRIRVVDDADRPVAPGQVGHVHFAGPMITPGYYRNPKATAAAITADGWLRSGDLGKPDDDRLILAGRSKDSIIVNGVNYYSHELEAALGRLDGVRAGSVAAVPTRPDGADTEQLAMFFATDLVDTDEAALHRLIITVRNGVILHSIGDSAPLLSYPSPRPIFPAPASAKSNALSCADGWRAAASRRANPSSTRWSNASSEGSPHPPVLPAGARTAFRRFGTTRRPCPNTQRYLT